MDAAGSRHPLAAILIRFDWAHGCFTVARGDRHVAGVTVSLGSLKQVHCSGEVLCELSSVARRAVVKHVVNAGDERLIAFILTEPDDVPMQIQVRQHIRQKLPADMMPQQFVTVSEFPVSSSGKLDRRQLLAGIDVPDSTGAVATDVSRTEPHVAQISHRLIGPQADQVRRADNFFDIGGLSLLAMEALREIQKDLGVHLTLRDLIYVWLASFCEKVDNREHGAEARRAPEPKGTTGSKNDNGVFRKVLGIFPDKDR